MLTIKLYHRAETITCDYALSYPHNTFLLCSGGNSFGDSRKPVVEILQYYSILYLSISINLEVGKVAKGGGGLIAAP